MTKSAFLLKMGGEGRKNYREKNNYFDELTWSHKINFFVYMDEIKLCRCHRYFHFSKNFQKTFFLWLHAAAYHIGPLAFVRSFSYYWPLRRFPLWAVINNIVMNIFEHNKLGPAQKAVPPHKSQEVETGEFLHCVLMRCPFLVSSFTSPCSFMLCDLSLLGAFSSF